MSVIAQLPVEMGGAEGKVVSLTIFFSKTLIDLVQSSKVAYIDTEGIIVTPCAYIVYYSKLYCPLQGTFRPERIKAIADRFGISGEDALGNILHGDWHLSTMYSVLFLIIDMFSSRLQQ